MTDKKVRRAPFFGVTFLRARKKGNNILMKESQFSQMFTMLAFFGQPGACCAKHVGFVRPIGSLRQSQHFPSHREAVLGRVCFKLYGSHALFELPMHNAQTSQPGYPALG